MTPKSTFMSPRTAAFEADVDRESIYRWIKTGMLPATRVGRWIRIRRDDFERFMTGRAG